MGQIYFDVPMRKQGPNPICWLACAAMIMSYKKQSTITIGSINNGFDPDNSSIGVLVQNYTEFYQKLDYLGFTSINPKVSPSDIYIENLLINYGPFLLTHYVSNVPYGKKRAASQASIIKADPNATHALVITGIDTDKGTATMNNPWGDKDQTIPISAIQTSMESLFIQDIKSVAYME